MNALSPSLVLVSLFVSMGTLGCSKKADSAPPPAQACVAEGISMEGDGSVARPAQCMQACTSDAQCIVVKTSCPGCCVFEAINVSYEESYEKARGPECGKYHGLVCGCSEESPLSRCVGNVCQLVE